LLVEFTRWIKCQKKVATILVPNKTKANNNYLVPNLDVLFRKWFPLFEMPSLKTTSLEEPMSPTNQKQQVSPELVIREQFLKEKKLARSTITLFLPIR